VKSKIVTILILVSLILPSISQAYIIIPYLDITIIKNTIDGDGVFDFNVFASNSFNEQLQITTEGGIGENYVGALSGQGTKFNITEDSQQGWKFVSVDCQSDNPQISMENITNGVSITAYPYSSITCTFTNKKQVEKMPALIVPGLVGTDLVNTQDLLWANLPRMILDPTDIFMDPLRFKNDLTSSSENIITGDVISKKTFNIGVGQLSVFDYTFGLKQEFVNQGYVENENLFTFPYDWRYGVSGKYSDGKTNSDLLGEKIQAIMAQTGSDKVDVVAHSQGGLVVKKYVVDHPTEHHIGKAIFVGVPNTGSLKAIKVLLQGDNFGVPGLSEAEMKKISANMPTVYDLLPTQKYYDVKGSFLKVIDQGSLLNNNDQTEKDLNYSEFESFLTLDHNFNSQALTDAKSLHVQDFDNFDMRTAGVDLYAIDGCKTGTIGTIVENRFKNIFGKSFVEYKSPKFAPGDGTVPLESSTNLPIDQDHKFYSLKGEHGKMLSDNGNRQEIVNLLTGGNLNVSDKIITQDISKCKLNGKAISVFSPVDIFVTDQDGHKMGLADDGSIINEIPNASFEIFGEHKFLYLPTDDGQIYDIKMKGTGAGTYTINSNNIVDNQVTGGQVFSNLPVTLGLTGSVNLSGDQTTLTVKETPQSSEKTILPSSNIDATASQDVLSPISGAKLSGIVGSEGFYRSDVGINLSATDNISGVLALNYNLDGAGWQKVSANSASLNVIKEGSHTVNFFATDNAGNNEQEQTLNFTIDKTAPEAVIEFDPATKDLKFSGQELGVVVNDKDDVVTLTDKAGNITEINLKGKDRKKFMLAEIKSLKYNGVLTDISKNKMIFSWLFDKNKNLKMLSQYVASKKDYNILAVYDGKNTLLLGRDKTGRIIKNEKGLKIIKISTDRGDFVWNY